jgi:hypothetical protein
VAVNIPIMPLELQVANVSNIITFTVGIFYLYFALEKFGNPASLKHFKIMTLGILLYSLLHEGMDIVAGTAIQNYMPEWIYGFWPVLILQSIGPVVFVIGAYRYNQEMFKTIRGEA